MENEFHVSAKPAKSNWGLFAYSLQEIRQMIIDHNYDLSLEQAAAIEKLLDTNMEVIFGRRNQKDQSKTYGVSWTSS